MKNKKSLLGLGLLALILVLGVGYAIVNSVDLTIGGKVSANSDLKVSFTGTPTVSDQTRVTATAEEGTLNATINVTKMTTIGEELKATYTIQNEEQDVNATITKKSITIKGENDVDLTEYFTVTTDVDSTTKTIEHKNTNTVTVTVALAKTPLTEATSTANVTIELTASPVIP